ncbi:M67 family metallopeptidase [Novosphingobium sp.]|uniref:M67 family metallopeptidase n=1 Tax=Novosphingobium sp. TaxID=1874826 RepID=UPI0038B7D3A6
MSLTLAPGVRQTMLDAANIAHPLEACGLLLGHDRHVAMAALCANVAPDPASHFEIDPAALIAAHRAERTGGPRLLGYFHSHPNGLARPSATDAASAARDGRIWAIVAGGEVTFWRDSLSGFEPLPTAPLQR